MCRLCTDFVGVDQVGSAVSVGDRVGLVWSDTVVGCATQCTRDGSCAVFKYTRADRTCTLYSTGNVKETVVKLGEWYTVGN